jgi:hypothetical protein
MKNIENIQKESAYIMKGLPLLGFLTETGDFRWIPHKDACNSSERARETLEVLKKMPIDRRNVWGTRLDFDKTIATCPIIRQDQDLSKEFDDFCLAYDTSKVKSVKSATKGETEK